MYFLISAFVEKGKVSGIGLSLRETVHALSYFRCLFVLSNGNEISGFEVRSCQKRSFLREEERDVSDFFNGFRW